MTTAHRVLATELSSSERISERRTLHLLKCLRRPLQLARGIVVEFLRVLMDVQFIPVPPIAGSVQPIPNNKYANSSSSPILPHILPLHHVLPQNLRHALRMLDGLGGLDAAGVETPVLAELGAGEDSGGCQGFGVACQNIQSSVRGAEGGWVCLHVRGVGTFECDPGCAEEMAVCGEDGETVGSDFDGGEEAARCH